ncbi:tetratricopeptide repeat protein [Nostoc sp. KVJ3]
MGESGCALDNLGRYDEAIASYDQAIEFQTLMLGITEVLY